MILSGYLYALFRVIIPRIIIYCYFEIFSDQKFYSEVYDEYKKTDGTNVPL